jgi:5-formyltetrahydrofolate cyclo-ligase
MACRWLLDRPERRIEECPSAPLRKATLRREIAAALSTMTPEVRRQKSQLIVRKLLTLAEFQQSRSLMTYVALPM